MLTNYEIPTTVHNIMAAGRFLNNRNRTFQQIFDSSNLAEEPDLKEAKQTVLEKFAEAVKTPEDMAKAQLALAETAENVMETMINEKEISSIAVRDLKIMRQEISLSTKMSKEENYAVPVLVGDELTNVQLKIVRGKKEKGKIDIFFETEKFGKVMAKIQVDETKINGYVATDSKETAALLKKQNDLLEEMLGKELELPVHMDYVQGSTINASDIFTARAEKQDSETAAYEVQTRQLYGISKSFLNAIKGIKP
jgi:hypothetical protein